MLHLAHGEVFMLGAYVGLVAATYFSGNILLAIVAAMLFTGALGLLIERVAFRPLRGAHHLAPLATTVAAGIVMQETARWYFGAEQQGFPSTITAEIWELGPLRVSSVQAFIVASALVLMGLVVMLLGGLGNVTGAMVGKLVLGIQVPDSPRQGARRSPAQDLRVRAGCGPR